MSNILIINGAKKFAHSNGQLNDTLTEVADGTLRDLGHDVRIVRADSDYDVKAEVQNFLWADVVIWQMPGWWMGAPWTVKKYIDDVFTEGHGTLYASSSTALALTVCICRSIKQTNSLAWNRCRHLSLMT